MAVFLHESQPFNNSQGFFVLKKIDRDLENELKVVI